MSEKLYYINVLHSFPYLYIPSKLKLLTFKFKVSRTKNINIITDIFFTHKHKKTKGYKK